MGTSEILDLKDLLLLLRFHVVDLLDVVVGEGLDALLLATLVDGGE
jgi:hypothetical protein